MVAYANGGGLGDRLPDRQAMRKGRSSRPFLIRILVAATAGGPPASSNFPDGIQADGGGQPADILDFGISIEGVRGLVAAVHPDLALDPQIIGRHQIVAEGGGDME